MAYAENTDSQLIRGLISVVDQLKAAMPELSNYLGTILGHIDTFNTDKIKKFEQAITAAVNNLPGTASPTLKAGLNSVLNFLKLYGSYELGGGAGITLTRGPNMSNLAKLNGVLAMLLGAEGGGFAGALMTSAAPRAIPYVATLTGIAGAAALDTEEAKFGSSRGAVLSWSDFFWGAVLFKAKFGGVSAGGRVQITYFPHGNDIATF